MFFLELTFCKARKLSFVNFEMNVVTGHMIGRVYCTHGCFNEVLPMMFGSPVTCKKLVKAEDFDINVFHSS